MNSHGRHSMCTFSRECLVPQDGFMPDVSSSHVHFPAAYARQTLNMTMLNNSCRKTTAGLHTPRLLRVHQHRSNPDDTPSSFVLVC